MNDTNRHKHKAFETCGNCGKEFEFDTRDFIIFDPGYVTCSHCKTRQSMGGQVEKIQSSDFTLYLIFPPSLPPDTYSH